MRSPNPKGIRRAQEDHLVDRLEVEAQQCVQLTSTNRPFGLSIELILRSNFCCQRYSTQALSAIDRTPNAIRSCIAKFVAPVCHVSFRGETARVYKEMAVGKLPPSAASVLPVSIPRESHPFPSRTRKLSLVGPMVLHAKVCGRLGNRRH